MKDILRAFDLFCMQSQLDVDRITALERSERVICCGSLKFDMESAPTHVSVMNLFNLNQEAH